MIISDRVSPGPANVTCDRQRLFPVLNLSLTYVLVLLRSNTLSFMVFPDSISGSSLGLAAFAFYSSGLASRLCFQVAIQSVSRDGSFVSSICFSTVSARC
jgi:hypothetical protein